MTLLRKIFQWIKSTFDFLPFRRHKDQLSSKLDPDTKPVSITAETKINQPFLSITFLAIGVILMYAGQTLLALPENTDQRGLSLLISGALFFLISICVQQEMRWINPPINVLNWIADKFSLSAHRMILLLCTPLFSYAAWLGAGTHPLMHAPILAYVLWPGTIALMLLVTRAPQSDPSSLSWQKQDSWLVVGLLIFAGIARFISLGTIPWVLTGDEGSAGIAAVDFINGNTNNIFKLGWFSFPSLYFFLQSLPIRILGQSTFSLRFMSAFAGTLSVAALYWAVRPALSRWWSFWIAAYLGAFHFHIHFSRIGLNNIWDALFFILASGAFYRAWTGNKSFHYILSGIYIGLCQYFYATSKILPILLIGWLLLAVIKSRRELQQRLSGLILLLLAFIVVILPLGVYYSINPDEFSSTYHRVSDSASFWQNPFTPEGQAIYKPFFQNLWTTLSMFNIARLKNWYPTNRPLLLVADAVLFLMGILLLIFRRSAKWRGWLLLWLASAMAIGALSKDAPAAQRFCYISALPAAIIVLAIRHITRMIHSIRPNHHFHVRILSGIIMSALLLNNVYYFFFVYVPQHSFGDLNTITADAVAHHFMPEQDRLSVYFLGGRMSYYTHSSIRFLLPEATGYDLFETITDSIYIDLKRPAAFVILPERSAELDPIKAAFPGGATHYEHSWKGDLLFISYELPR